MKLATLEGLGCGCDKVAGLGDDPVSDAEANQIITDYAKQNITVGEVVKISTEAYAGQYNTLSTHIKAIVNKICTKGVMNTMSQYWYVLAGGAALIGGIGYYVGKKK